MTKVYINGRSVVHKGDGQTNVCGTPDVCKTPSPGGPVPVPYVNAAQDRDLANGSRSVSIEGNPVALADSNLNTSTGDEPGTAGGGLMSSKTKGKLTWGSYSIDVKIEGQGVVRFLDVTHHNGNTFNAALAQQGGPATGRAFGDDPLDGEECEQCHESKEKHRIPETNESFALAMQLYAKLEWVRQNIPASERPTLKPKKKGYMIGVLICKGGSKFYAAMSGEETRPGFNHAVDLLHKENAMWTEAGTGQVDLANVLNSQSILDSKEGEAPLPVPQTLLTTLHNRIPTDLTDEQGNRIPRNELGVCAAPKLIQAALKDKPQAHHPLHLTEIWYSPCNATVVRTVVMHVENENASGRKIQQKIEEFGNGQSVSSCLTCQVQLAPMLCGHTDAMCP
jgi:hypothetical protein